MDEERNLIPYFFKVAQCTFPYKVIEISKFWDLLGAGNNTQCVIYLWNGNIMKIYEGTGNNKFDLEGLKWL